MKIDLSQIRPNPHRNLNRNPISDDQVKALIDSYERNGVWPNIVVRLRKTDDGCYELAYGHNRLEAMHRLGMTEGEFIVADISDWGMYTAMVDENESQRQLTPELVYENIESGIEYLEPVIRECETLDEFRLAVDRSTASEIMKPQDYANVRNNVLDGQGLGVSFLERELPGERSTDRKNIQVVVDSHYANTKAKAKQAKAKAKTKQASAKRKASAAAKDAAEAKAAQAEAERLEREAQQLEQEAGKLKESGVEQELLLSFPSTRAMQEFAASVKRHKIPSKHHKALAEYLEKSGAAARTWGSVISNWWYRESGQEAKDRERNRNRYEQEQLRWQQDKSLDDFVAEIRPKVRDLIKRLDAIKPFADQVEGPKLIESISAELGALISVAQAIRENLPREENVVDMDLKRLETK